MCVHTPSCPPFSNPLDCQPPGSSIHGIFQARILEWVAIFYGSVTLQGTWNHHSIFNRLYCNIKEKVKKNSWYDLGSYEHCPAPRSICLLLLDNVLKADTHEEVQLIMCYLAALKQHYGTNNKLEGIWAYLPVYTWEAVRTSEFSLEISQRKFNYLFSRYSEISSFTRNREPDQEN